MNYYVPVKFFSQLERKNYDLDFYQIHCFTINNDVIFNVTHRKGQDFSIMIVLTSEPVSFSRSITWGGMISTIHLIKKPIKIKILKFRNNIFKREYYTFFVKSYPVYLNVFNRSNNLVGYVVS